MYSDNHADILTPDSQVISKNVPASDIKTHIAQYYNAKVSQPVNKKLPAAGWDPGDIWYEFKKIGPIEYGKLSPAEQAQIGQAAMYAHDRGFDAPLFYLDDLKAAQVGKGPLKTPIGVGLVPTGGQPLKINTKTVFKTKYTHGTIVAVKLDHDPPLRITWSESNYEKPKFIIQSRHPDGAWAPISFGLMQKLGIEGNSLGKGQLYEAFKDDPGWKTPGGAPPAPTVPVVSTVKKSKIPQHDSSKTAINKYFTDLTIAKWNTLSNGERIELENLAIDQQTVGNNTPSGVLALINKFKNAQPTPVVTEMTEMPITHMTPKEIKKLPHADFVAAAKHITDSEWKTLSFDQQVAIVNHDGDTGLGGNTSATPNLTALINKNGMAAFDAGATPQTVANPTGNVLSPPTGKFELLDDTGVSGDGYAPGGQWGKFGAAGVLIQWDSSSAEPRYLLVQRGPGVSSNQGKWQLPGGALNGSENAYQAAARETVEEVGAPKSYLTKLQPVGEHVYTHEPTGWQYTTIAARSSTPFMPKVDGTETSNAAWFTAAEIDKMLTQGQIVPKLDTALKPIIDAYPQVTRAGGGTGDTGFFVPKNLNSYDDEDLDGFYETISQADWDGLDSGSKSYLTKIANQAEANGDTDLPKFTIENLKTGTGPNANETFMPTLDQLIVPVDQMTKQQFVEWLDAQTPLSYEQLTPKEKQLVTATVADNDVQELFNYATSKPSGAKVNIIDVKRSDLESTGQTVGTHGAQIYQSKFTGDRYLFKPTPDKLDYTIEVDVAVNRLQKKLGIEAPPLRAFNVDGTPGTLQEMLPYPTASFNAKDLTPTQVNDLVAHQAFDWLISQHDTAPSNILQLPNGKFMPIDKTQAFKYFPFDKLDNDFTPNPEKTVYQRMWTAFEKGQIDVPSPTDGATGAGMALWNMQHMSDADFHAILRPYVEAAAKRGALMNPNVPAYGPLAKPPITYQQNDVDNFLALITERKNNLLADFQEFYDAEVKKRKANGFSTGVKLAPTPAVATPSKSVTPAFVPLPAPPASTTAQVLGGGTPLKISSKLIHVTKHANLSVVAERVTPAGQHHRLIWDEYGKKYVHQAQNDNAAWLQLSTYSKAGAYEQFKNQTDWKVPGTLTMGPPPAHDIGAAVTLSPVKPKLPQFSAASIQAQHGGIGDFTTGHKDKIYTKFKHGTTMGGVTSTAAGPKAFKALALTVAEINANPQFAGQKVNLLQALKIIDEHKVTKHGGVNSNAYEKKIVEWLGTPAGKKSAAGLIAWAEEVAQAKTAGTPLPASPLGTAVNIAPASSIGTPATTSSLSFPVVSPTEAAAMHSKVMATKVWSSQQRSTIKNYTGGGFDPINKALRFGGGSPTTVQKAKLIQSAMYPAQRSFIVHRGTNDIGVPNLKTFADVQALLGKSFEEKGFSSGSVGGHAAFSGKTFLLEIEVPQGTPGAFIRSASQYPHENEYLLAAGTKFKVLKVTDNGGSWPGKYIIRVRVIP